MNYFAYVTCLASGHIPYRTGSSGGSCSQVLWGPVYCQRCGLHLALPEDPAWTKT